MKQDILLAPLTTFHIGGNAKYFVEVNTKEKLLEALAFAEQKNVSVFILGGGSNIVVNDNGYDGLVIKLINDYWDFVEKDEFTEVTSGAGVIWDELVQACIDKNLQGIECLSGIPGSVGAAPVQNIGAYGQELKDTFINLEAYDTKTSDFVVLTKADCQFGYRDSVFKKSENKNRYIIWQVTLALQKNTRPSITYESLKNYLKDNAIQNPSLTDVRSAVIELRKRNHIDPKIAGNAGSFFKNPLISKERLEALQKQFPEIPHFPMPNNDTKIFAGWLIEQAGWKGKKHKNVSVSPKHALILINPEHKATAEEVEELAQQIQESVKKKFDITLEREVQTI